MGDGTQPHGLVLGEARFQLLRDVIHDIQAFRLLGPDLFDRADAKLLEPAAGPGRRGPVYDREIQLGRHLAHGVEGLVVARIQLPGKGVGVSALQALFDDPPELVRPDRKMAAP